MDEHADLPGRQAHIAERISNAIRELRALQVDCLAAEILQLDVFEILIVVGAAYRRVERVEVQLRDS